MNLPHYTPRERPSHYWFFTSPIGVHEDCFDEALCKEMAEKVKARHIERARGEGFEAESLRRHFERHEPEAIAV
jgi:hypothetical protein